MKKLYEIKELHGGPKSHVVFINGYLLADNDEEVFNHIANKIGYDNWKEYEFTENVEEWDEFKTWEEFKKSIIESCGDLESEDGWDDAYYGVTKYGWRYVMEISDEEIATLKKIGRLE